MSGESWWNGWVLCGICGHKHVAVIEIEPDQTEPIVSMECTKCGNQSCMPFKEDPEDDDDEPGEDEPVDKPLVPHYPRG